VDAWVYFAKQQHDILESGYWPGEEETRKTVIANCQKIIEYLKGDPRGTAMIPAHPARGYALDFASPVHHGSGHRRASALVRAAS
jgi:hypothetical protein